MSIFNVLSLIGGLCLFLFGMNIMGAALEKTAGGKLESILKKATTNRFLGLFSGLGITAIIQSSSATTVIVVGFVNSGLMTLKQAINVIMGANIGTTVTSWILSLGGIDSSNTFVKLLKPSSFTPILALIGIILYMFNKSEKKKNIGLILLGFATLMTGMEAMSGSVSGLSEVEGFRNLFIMFQNPLLGILVGAILTAIIQSSSASVGILQALTVTGSVTYASAIPIIMGQNIGTCITAILSSIGTNKNAKRTALVHLSFNIIGAAIFLIAYCIVRYIFHPILLTESANYMGIAIFHSIFNICCTVILFPMASLLEKMVLKVIPDTETHEQAIELDDRLLITPGIAIKQAESFAKDMANVAITSLNNAIAVTKSYSRDLAESIRTDENKTDDYEDKISTYLIKIGSKEVTMEDSSQTTKLLKVIGDFERISDHSLNILESMETMKNEGWTFSDEANKELGTLTDAITECTDITLNAFVNNDSSLAYKVEPIEEVIDDLVVKLRNDHIHRLQSQVCGTEKSVIWEDLLINFERVSDHCSNIALCIIDANEENMNMHESLKAIKYSSEDYKQAYKMYEEKYSIR